MSAATVSRGARAFVVASVGWLVAWQLLVRAGAGRRAAVVAGVYGFVLHMVFGKGYALVPSYFDRELAFPRAPAAQLPLTLAGTAALAAAAAGAGPGWLRPAGDLLWAAGVGVFVGAVGWTIRDNLTGRETGTAGPNRDRRGIDRFANAFVPAAIAYLLAAAAVPPLDAGGVVDLPAAAVSHLLAAGTAALSVFALGFRLLPRFLAVHPRRAAVAVVLPAGAVGPALLAAGFAGAPTFRVGAAVQAVAVVGFAAAYADMYARSDRDRVGFPVVLLGAAGGAAAVAVGLHLAFVGPERGLAAAHVRLTTLGFLGLVVVGVSYQFYPPGIGTLPGVGDRLALAVAGGLAAGVAIEVSGLLAGAGVATAAGRTLAAAGAAGYAYVIWSLFLTRRRRRR